MRLTLTPLLCLLTLAAGCTSGHEYELRGQILAVDEARQELTIKHGDIRGFMPGMTMAFKVEDAAVMAGRTPGELVTATLVVTDTRAYLSAVTPTGRAPLTERPPAPRVDLLAPGARVAPITLIDAAGTAHPFTDWRGRVVVLTFVYTRCPLPDFCPRMDRAFAAVQQAVRADPALLGRVALLSVTLDPDYDTPAVIGAHARRAGADPAVWEFMTGDRQAIEPFAAQFGVAVFHDDGDGVMLTHNLRTAVVAPDGTLAATLPGGDWRPAELLDAVRRAGA